jgi:N-terminal half of MaoC dehydratase
MAELDPALIGKVFEASAPVRVTAEMIEQFCGAIGVAVERDSEGRVIAPLSISGSFRAAEDIFDHLPRMERRLLGSMELDFVIPIKSGDEIRISSQVAEVYEKTGRSGGLVFTVIRSELKNQRAEIVTRIDHRFTHRKAKTADA